MKKRDENRQRFVEWFKASSARLLALAPEEAAEEIGSKLIEFDKRLGVEVGEEPAEPNPPVRELIVTAFSDPDVFDDVRLIVQGVSKTPGWQVVALKPPRGFSFTVELGNRTVDARDLKYVMLPNHGIGLVVPSEVMEFLRPEDRDTEELAWLIVEGGIGEELAAKLNHIEFVSSPQRKAKPLEELPVYLTSGS